MSAGKFKVQALVVAILAMLAFADPVLALVEIRGFGTSNVGSADQLNSYIAAACGSCGTKGDTINGYGADVLVKIPMISMGFGLRYETLGIDVNFASVTKLKYNYDRIALLLNYRIWDTGFYLGPILSYGLSDTSKLKSEVSGTTTFDGTAKKTSSYSVGIEAGLKLGLFRLGGELGISNTSAKDIQNSSGASLTSGSTTLNEIVHSGSYGKVLLGVGF